MERVRRRCEEGDIYRSWLEETWRDRLPGNCTPLSVYICLSICLSIYIFLSIYLAGWDDRMLAVFVFDTFIIIQLSSHTRPR